MSLMLAAAVTLAADHRGVQFLGWDNLEGWHRSAGSRPGEVVLTSDPISCATAWDELVVSWNADTPPSTGLKTEARAIYGDHSTKFYTLGLWSNDPSQYPRESVRNQKDDAGDVLTDTLVLKKRAEKVQLRLTLSGGGTTSPPRVRFLGACFLDTQNRSPTLPPNRNAWGKILEVPQRSQVTYPGGETAWCSPTCTSMVLAYWARQLGRPSLDLDVPEVAKGVFDANWPGTGNWVFNTAFAGSLPGLRGYVARLSDISELEDWIACGIPVVVSVAYDVLRDKPRRAEGDGHLMVCVGFTDKGDVVINDPGTSRESRRTFPRANLAAAWTNSHQTVYLIYPEAARLPTDRFHHWHRPLEHN